MLRVLTGGLVTLSLSLSLGLALAAPGTTAPPTPGGLCDGRDCGLGDARARAVAGTVDVTVSGYGVTSDGGSFEVTASTHKAAAACGYHWFATGQEYASWWSVDGQFTGVQDRLPEEDRFTPWSGYREHATDAAGAWWVPMCSDATWSGTRDEFVAYRDAYQVAHDPVYVEENEAPPSGEVSPEVLAQIAYESMDLPVGVVRWNPSMAGQGVTVVNLDTWVWVEGAPTSVTVTAQVASGTWAQVDAGVSGMELSAPGADPASCPDTGAAWTAGADRTSCAIRFTRSSANQPVKDGQSLPTSTLTVAATWTASWVSSLDPTPRALPDQTITTTAEIPVAEIQTLVTRG